MATKTTFNNPDSQEREYVRLLLRYSKQLQANVNRVLLPRIDDIILQFKVETRTDSWIDTLDALIAELGVLALTALGSVVTKLPGQFAAVSRFNEGQFKLVVKANTGLPLPPVMPGAPSSAILGVNVFRSEPFLKPLAEGWISENTALIKSLPTRLHPELEGIIRRGVMNGQSVKDIKDQIKSRYGVTDYRAKLIAQDQTLKLNADLTRYRLQSVGVEEYVWRSVQDSRVRPEHADRNGKTYSWDKGPSNGQHPGQEVRCRCRAEAVWDEGEDEAVFTASKAEPKPQVEAVTINSVNKSVGYTSKLTDAEKDAVREYQSGLYNSRVGAYANLQSVLKTGVPTYKDAWNELEGRKILSDFRSAFNKGRITKDLEVYRGIRAEKGREGIALLNVGDRYKETGITSTSTSKSVQEKFSERLNRSDTPVKITIKAKAGTGNVLVPDDVNKHPTEKEVTFGPDTNFKVIKKTTSNGVVNIVLEVE